MNLDSNQQVNYFNSGGTKAGERQQPARRPLIGQGTMNISIPIQVNTVAPPTGTTQGRPIIKGIQTVLRLLFNFSPCHR